MIYLDDLAVWAKTQKAQVIRGVVCGIGGLIIIGMFVSSSKESDHLEEVIEENKTTLSETDYKLTQANKKITDYETNSVVKTETARDVGDAIAEYQTQYGTIIRALNNQNSDVDNTNAQLTEVQNNISELITDGGNSVNPWYQLSDNVTSGNYTWEFLTRQATSAKVIPTVWQCSQTMYSSGSSTSIKDVLSVAFADYDIETRLFSNVEIYQTYNGRLYSENVTSNSMMNGLVGSVVPDECWNSQQVTEDGTTTYWTQFNKILNDDYNTDSALAAASDSSSASSNVASTDASNLDSSTTDTKNTDQTDDSGEGSSVDSSTGSSTRSNTELLDSVLNGGN